VFQAAEKTLENIQPPLSAISTNLSPVIEKEEMIVVKVTEKPAARARSKPKVETKVVNGKTKRTQQTTKKEKKIAFAIESPLARLAIAPFSSLHSYS
jgi:hypothetical protein